MKESTLRKMAWFGLGLVVAAFIFMSCETIYLPNHILPQSHINIALVVGGIGNLMFFFVLFKKLTQRK